MRNKHLVAAFVGLCVVAWAPTLLAQDAPGIVVVADWQVTPGKEAQFAEAREEGVAFFAEHDFPHNQAAFSSQNDNVVRFTVNLDSWQEMGTVEQWFLGLPSPPPSGANDASDNIKISLWRPRPDLNYLPDNRRLGAGEAGLVREIRFSLRPGKAPEAAAILLKMSEVNKRHNVETARIVWFQFSGSDGPVVSLFSAGRDVADLATQTSEETERMGDEIRTLRRQLSSLARTREFMNWTVRRDLRYQRAN